MSAATRHKHTNDACLANVLPYNALRLHREISGAALWQNAGGDETGKGTEKQGRE